MTRFNPDKCQLQTDAAPVIRIKFEQLNQTDVVLAINAAKWHQTVAAPVTKIKSEQLNQTNVVLAINAAKWHQTVAAPVISAATWHQPDVALATSATPRSRTLAWPEH